MKYSNKAFPLLFLLLLIGLSQGQEYQCEITTSNTFTPNSIFKTNLNRLLSSLSSNANQSNGYYNTTVGSENDTVYGLFLCRGDFIPATCQACVSKTTKRVLEFCPNLKQAFMWHENCLVRYSDQYFFGEAKMSPRFGYYNVNNVSDVSSFNQVLGNTLREATREAANGGESKKYATKETNLSSLQTLYSMVQCTPDLEAMDCTSCVQQAITYFLGCCDGHQGGGVLTASCTFRYDLYSFYRDVPSSSPPILTPPAQQNSTAPPPPPSPQGKTHISTAIIIAIVASIVLGLLLFFLTCCFIIRRKKSKKYNSVPEEKVEVSSVDFLQLDLETIKLATNNFSDDNKLGEGGFGEVFKGSLLNGQDIAVKRLSKNSTQGVEEFKNEVVSMAKLQHRNLVRLLGFCLEGEEKILVYEFIPNKSLDNFLFDDEKRHELSWPRRFNIIEGIARGMLYLHEDSQLKIIHRDLKASNILLDKDLNPKISDFGTSRIFSVDQTREVTKRVVGTFGYMPPEYIMQGHFSTKMDVYSYGILVLEIISGKKNSSFHDSNISTYAWRKWKDGRALELLDTSMGDCYNADDVNRCIHIALSCVQEDPAQRPTMQKIVLMLNSHSVTLVLPERPPFLVHSNNEQPLESDKSTTNKSVSDHSVDEASITQAYPR